RRQVHPGGGGDRARGERVDGGGVWHARLGGSSGRGQPESAADRDRGRHRRAHGPRRLNRRTGFCRKSLGLQPGGPACPGGRQAPSADRDAPPRHFAGNAGGPCSVWAGAKASARASTQPKDEINVEKLYRKTTFASALVLAT